MTSYNDLLYRYKKEMDLNTLRAFLFELCNDENINLYLEKDNEARKSIVDKISSDMDYDQVSQIINDHVTSTVQDEISRTQKEDEHVKELEDVLAANEEITTESAIDTELEKMGEGKKEYIPSLFTGIMINKTNLYTESADLDEDHIEKKAFFESVKEYTLWDMVHTLGLEKFSKNDIDFTATKYARGTI